MKKQLIMAAGLSSLLVLGGMGTTALAASTEPPAKGTVSFVVDDDGKSEIVDPEDPSITDPKPELPVGPETEGALRLDRVSNIDFGSNKLASQGREYYALFEQDQITTTKMYPTSIQLTDARGAGTLGWKVEVKNNGVFTNKEDKKIEGAKITLSDLQVKAASGQKEELFPTLSSTEKDISIGTNVELLSAASTKDSGIGTGTWTMHAGTTDRKTTGKGKNGNEIEGTVDPTKANRNPAVKLDVPNGQTIYTDSVYTTDLVWSITTAP